MAEQLGRQKAGTGQMQLGYVGNEFDRMKGRVLGGLLQRNLLQGLVVDPMAHPASCWTSEQFSQYAQVLGLEGPDQIAAHRVQWGIGKRDSYFAELDCYAGQDFFLDPTAGVATSKTTPKHVKPSEVLRLLQDRNVVAVYQHGAWGQTIENRVREVVQALQRFMPSIECLAYMEEKASLLFLARQALRLRDIEDRLEQLSLGGSLERYAPDRRFLTRVQLANYKSIAAADVQLSQVLLLVGPNGSGKSNFLDALRFVADALNTSLDHALRVRGGVDLVQRKPRDGAEPFGLRLQFELADSRGWYALTIRAKAGGGYEVCREECHLAERQGGRRHFYRVECGQVVDASIAKPPAAAADRLYLVTISGFDEFRPAFDALAGMRFANPVPERIRAVQARGNASSLNRDCGNAASVLGGLEERCPDTKGRIDEYLGGIVPGISEAYRWPRDIYETVGFLRRTGDGDVRLPASSMSDGTLRALGVLLALFQGAAEEEGGRRIVGIEEPEAGQHPGAVEVLTDAIREAALHSQVLVTSHSAELLEGIADESIVAVAMNRGTTRFGVLDEASRSAIRDRLFTAGELLRMDQLGMAELDEPLADALDLFAAES